MLRVKVTKDGLGGSVNACGVGVLIVSPSSAIVGLYTGALTELVEMSGATTGSLEITVPDETAGWMFSAQPAGTDSKPKMAAMNNERFTED
jgi:hypothetical protein